MKSALVFAMLLVADIGSAAKRMRDSAVWKRRMDALHTLGKR